MERAIEDVVDFAELGEFLHQPLKPYSLGMQARVMFASATATQPDTLIVDEVLSQLAREVVGAYEGSARR